MLWLRSHWRWCALNTFAVFTSLYVFSQGSTGWDSIDTFDSGFESGKWAIRFLLTSLLMTPLNTYFGWKSAVKLRKSAGLWAFGFASAHILLYVREAKWEWLTISMPLYLKLGLAGIVILGALAATSNRWAMRQLGKNWKRLHRLVYVSGIAVVSHAMLATAMSKKLLFRDPQAESELKIYMAVLAVLLFVRIPLVRQWLKSAFTLLKRVPKLTERSGEPPEPELLPLIHGRESGVSVKPTFIIPSTMPNPSELSSSDSSPGRTHLAENSIDRRPVKILPEEKTDIR